VLGAVAYLVHRDAAGGAGTLMAGEAACEGAAAVEHVFQSQRTLNDVRAPVAEGKVRAGSTSGQLPGKDEFLASWWRYNDERIDTADLCATG
jgi:hypothetical protein